MDKIIVYITSYRFILSICILVVLGIVLLLLKRLIAGYLNKFAEKDGLSGRQKTYMKLFGHTARILLILLAVILILQVHGINVSSLVAGLGIVGIVVGLALQDVLKDLIMGCNILSGSFFMVGDVVQYGSVKGEVMQFSLRYTKIRDLATNALHTISNRNISEISRVSHQMLLKIPTGYEEDPAAIESVLEELASEIREMPNVEDCAFLGLSDLDDSSVQYLFRINASPLLHGAVQRQVLGHIRHVFCQRGISIPYPQLDVHTC